eukprot:6146744-Amphidinium_carterae.1
MEDYTAGPAGNKPTFGCATCGSGICSGCVVAAYAMTGTSMGVMRMAGGCPYCRAPWTEMQSPFFWSNGSAVRRGDTWVEEDQAGDALNELQRVDDDVRNFLREVRAGQRSPDLDGSCEAWMCMWLSGQLDRA